VVAPQDSSLLGLVSVIAPIVVTGNACVVIASTDRPIPAITLAEVLATSDVIGGVINILTGDPAEIMPWLASHADVNAVDLSGVTDHVLATDLEYEAAGTVKRVHSAVPDHDWLIPPTLARIRTFVETKTVWHPIGV
jgi:acyl-CoA reductase-like NAD-dependent aldehyde dehydrogenase